MKTIKDTMEKIQSIKGLTIMLSHDIKEIQEDEFLFKKDVLKLIDEMIKMYSDESRYMLEELRSKIEG